MQKQQVPIELIIIDAGTQQRPLDEEILNKYLEMMKEGYEYPPVEIIRDAEKYYLWEGFHRLECTKRLEKKFIYAYVKEGKLKDAMWESFGANKKHGFPRQRGVVKSIIKKILCDKKWSKVSNRKIADHVGVTVQYVGQIDSGLKKEEKVYSEPENNDSISKLSLPIDEKKEDKKKKKTTKKRQRSDTVKVTRGDSTYEQTKEVKRKPILDFAKQEVPENLRELYENRKEIVSLLNRLSKIQDDIIKAVDNRNPIFTYINTNQLKRDYKNFRSQIKAALPNYVCPYCAGKGGSCKSCTGIGLLNDLRYAAVIKELKAKK